MDTLAEQIAMHLNGEAVEAIRLEPIDTWGAPEGGAK